MNHLQRAARFKELHYRPGIFVVANAWDGASARLLENMGFEALATTSAGMAFAIGKPDNPAQVCLEDALKNAQQILDNSSLPVSADLMNGFGDHPEDCALTIKLAAATGLSGASIEDATGRSQPSIYDFKLSVERVKAAVKAVRALNKPFMLTARAENYLHGNPDLNDTIDRLVAYAEAGADVLFAPGIRTLEELETLVKAVNPKPVNVLFSLEQNNYGIKQLEDIGVKRISLGSGLFRVAYAYLQETASQFLPREKQAGFVPTVQHAEYNELFTKEINIKSGIS
jgi:2-methylisocitrate lyase-like PEP mutase family enzyme